MQETARNKDRRRPSGSAMWWEPLWSSVVYYLLPFRYQQPLLPGNSREGEAAEHPPTPEAVAVMLLQIRAAPSPNLYMP
jgi:hypothetical protein